MRVVIQRVKNASVVADGKLTGSVSSGLLILLGIEDADTAEDIEWLCQKIVNLRIFNDENGIPNYSVKDIDGELLVVSQFTLHAQTKKGNRPSYIKASKAGFAKPMYESFLSALNNHLGKKTEAGIFGADMQVSLVNDGPITIIIDSKQKDF